MTTAAEKSVNTYFLQLELATGMCPVVKMAEAMGVKIGRPIGDPPVDLVKKFQYIPSFTLGTAEVSPMSVAEAYATVAARGKHCNPVIIAKITTRSGKNLAVPDANCQQVMDKSVADGVNKMLKSVVNNGTGRPARVFGEGDIAGKTGTINSNEAVWFAGYTPEIAGVAMISIDNTMEPFSKALRRKGKDYRSRGVRNYTVPSTDAFLSGTGSGDAGEEIWKPVMTEYLKRVPNTSFQDPPSEIEIGKQVPVPSLAGLGLLAAQRKLEAAGFTVEKQYVFSETEPKWEFISGRRPRARRSRSSARSTWSTRRAATRTWSRRRNRNRRTSKRRRKSARGRRRRTGAPA